MSIRSVGNAKGAIPSKSNSKESRTIKEVFDIENNITDTKYISNPSTISITVVEANPFSSKVKSHTMDVYKRKPYINFTIEGIKKFVKLSNGAQTLLIEMFETIKDSNKFVTNTDKIKSIIHTKRSDEVYKVIKELKDADFLYKAGKENKDTVYVINHNLWFRGNYNKFMNKLLIIYTDVIPDSDKKIIIKNSADNDEYIVDIDTDCEID